MIPGILTFDAESLLLFFVCLCFSLIDLLVRHDFLIFCFDNSLDYLSRFGLLNSILVQTFVLIIYLYSFVCS